MNQQLTDVSQAIMDNADNPQAINEILRKNHMTRDSYRQAVREAVGEGNEWMNRAAGP